MGGEGCTHRLMGSVNVCRPHMKVTLLIHRDRPSSEAAAETHPNTVRCDNETGVYQILYLPVCLHLCICVSITCPVSDVTLSPNKRVRFLADEISQGLDVVETGCLCTRTFCKICCERASEDIYIFTQHLGYGQPAET